MSFRARIVGMVERMWEGDDVISRGARAMLWPAERAFALVVARRNARFDEQGPGSGNLAALSVGNLTVGGTGKTPVAAWCAERLRALGARPAIVLRGYGDDEWRVHTVLNPRAPVIVTPDRVAGLVVARTRGCDCAIMDDAFQHRRAARTADLVLLSADRWTGRVHLLPAGPYREPLASLRRADVAVITSKAADRERVEALVRMITDAAPGVPIVLIQLRADTLRLAAALPRDGGARRTSADRTGMLSHPIAWLRGRAIVAASAIGDPRAFEAQLQASGADVRQSHRFADHHTFGRHDAALIARRIAGVSDVVCTLKDAVKLAPLWPREAPTLWYLSQTVVVDRGGDAIDRVFARVLAARDAAPPTR